MTVDNRTDRSNDGNTIPSLIDVREDIMLKKRVDYQTVSIWLTSIVDKINSDEELSRNIRDSIIGHLERNASAKYFNIAKFIRKDMTVDSDFITEYPSQFDQDRLFAFVKYWTDAIKVYIGSENKYLNPCSIYIHYCNSDKIYLRLSIEEDTMCSTTCNIL
jgi:hypothetical protein